MQLFNYLRVLGKFTNAYQLIELDLEPSDRNERRMVKEALTHVDASWLRRKERLLQLEKTREEPFNYEEEEANFRPKQENGKVLMPLQFIQDFMVKRIAAVQNSASIHSKGDVEELLEVFDEYGVELFDSFESLRFERFSWTAVGRQKPKVLMHATREDESPVCIRFEAATELAQKIMNAALDLKLIPGDLFSLSVAAEDPAFERNKRAGKKVVDEGLYVNHNLLLQVGDKSHTGHPPKGERFIQKPTMEYMENLFHQIVRQYSYLANR